MKLVLNEVTTQIEPHDTYAEIFDTMRRANTILLDLSQDMWRYISDGWVTQKPKEGEVGSSAMPHKVNPIDFENAEGNLGVANALFTHLSQKLPISRLQRDLSDSTVVRTFGTAFAHSLIAYASLVRGFGKISVNSAALLDALRAHPEVIAEAIQTILRREGVEMPYEKLKALTRGRTVTLEGFAAFIDGLEVSEEVKKGSNHCPQKPIPALLARWRDTRCAENSRRRAWWKIELTRQKLGLGFCSRPRGLYRNEKTSIAVDDAPARVEGP